MDYAALTKLRKHHAGWRLLAADTAPFVAGFLHDAFVRPNARSIRQDELVALLDEHLHHLRERHGAKHPRPAQHYLDEWAGGEVAYLRKYYPPGSDEPEFDLTPAAEKALEWLAGLGARPFVGTESRLLTIFQLLREVVRATETDPRARIAELERQRAAIDQELADLAAGKVAKHDPTRVKEQFLQAEETARRLLSDFRQVEENFRQLDRQTRERIATSSGSKGELLDAVFGEQHAIAASDQGRSFRAFWAFLMSLDRQEELAALVARALALEDVAALRPDELLPKIQFHLLEAGEKVQRTSATLVEQLRRYLDEQVWLENKRIVELIRELEQHAVAIAQLPPTEKDFAELPDLQPTVALPFTRALYVPARPPRFDATPLALGDAEFGVDALYAQHHVDEDALRRRIRQALRGRTQVTLAEVVAAHPLTQGLAEVVAYWHVASRDPHAFIDDAARERMVLGGDDDGGRVVTLPRIVFTRGVAAGGLA